VAATAGHHNAVVWRVALGLAAVGVAWFFRPGPGGAAVPRPTSEQAPNTRHVFLRDCATCHGADGRGTGRGPDLRGAGAGLVDYYLSTGRMPLGAPDESVRRGPPAYSPDRIRSLVRYVEQLVGRDGPGIPRVDPAAGDLSAGGTLFRLQCAACHAWSGKGGALLHVDAPTTHPSTPVQIAEAVRGGPGNMPAFGAAALTRSQLDSVVRYVRYLDRPDDRGGLPLWHLGPLAEGAVAVFLGLGVVVLATRWIGTRR
jgi:ubiquinol-cytochrome c reductase cytochrome c subunit